MKGKNGKLTGTARIKAGAKLRKYAVIALDVNSDRFARGSVTVVKPTPDPDTPTPSGAIPAGKTSDGRMLYYYPGHMCRTMSAKPFC